MTQLVPVVEKLRMYWQRLKRPRTVEEALRHFLAPSVVDALVAEVHPSDLIEQAALLTNVETEELLEIIAAKLGIGHATELQLPTPRLFSISLQDPEQLKHGLAIIQASHTAPSGYALVVSDLAGVDVQAFSVQGTQILLALGREVAETWKRYEWSQKKFKPQITEAQAFAVLKQLAIDAAARNAREVFIGHPNEDAYEFFGASGLYSGKIHPAIYPTVLKSFETQTRIMHAVGEDGIKQISLTLTRNFEHPVICLSWSVIEEQTAIRPVETNGQVREITAQSRNGVERSALQQPESTQTEQTTTERLVPQAEKCVKQASTKPSIVRTISAASSGPRRVLLLDDDPRFLVVLGKILESKGWEVHRESQAEAALHLLQEEKFSPDVIVSDVHMPNMNGEAFLKRLQELHIDSPIIMLTSDDDHLLEAELALLGADAFVRKQDDPRILLAWCNNLATKRLRRTSLPSANGNGAIANGINHSYD